jgi:hypothetical protein
VREAFGTEGRRARSGAVAGFERLASDRDGFARAAAAAIRAAGFRPGVRDGRPVASSVTIRVSFRLE